MTPSEARAKAHELLCECGDPTDSEHTDETISLTKDIAAALLEARREALEDPAAKVENDKFVRELAHLRRFFPWRDEEHHEIRRTLRALIQKGEQG